MRLSRKPHLFQIYPITMHIVLVLFLSTTDSVTTKNSRNIRTVSKGSRCLQFFSYQTRKYLSAFHERAISFALYTMYATLRIDPVCASNTSDILPIADQLSLASELRPFTSIMTPRQPALAYYQATKQRVLSHPHLALHDSVPSALP